MTPEEAKALLATYRAGEAAPDDPGVRQALELVRALPDLAAWWESERAFDRVFARELATITPPPELANAILRGGATIFTARHMLRETFGENYSETPAPAKADADAPAAANVVPFPNEAAQAAALRAALTKNTAAPRAPWRRAMPWWSMAASFVVFLLGICAMYFKTQPLNARGDELPGCAQYVSAQLDQGLQPSQHSEKVDEMLAYFAQNQAPHPDVLPASVAEMKLAGFDVWEWQNRRIAVVRLQNGPDLLHLFILAHADFPRDTVAAGQVISQEGRHTVTEWSEGPYIYLLLRDPAGP